MIVCTKFQGNASYICQAIFISGTKWCCLLLTWPKIPLMQSINCWGPVTVPPIKWAPPNHCRCPKKITFSATLCMKLQCLHHMLSTVQLFENSSVATHRESSHFWIFSQLQCHNQLPEMLNACHAQSNCCWHIDSLSSSSNNIFITSLPLPITPFRNSSLPVITSTLCHLNSV